MEFNLFRSFLLDFFTGREPDPFISQYYHVGPVGYSPDPLGWVSTEMLRPEGLGNSCICLVSKLVILHGIMFQEQSWMRFNSVTLPLAGIYMQSFMR